MLSNAYKYMDHGTVAVRVQWQDGTQTLSVADTGKGISKENIPYISFAGIVLVALRQPNRAAINDRLRWFMENIDILVPDFRRVYDCDLTA